MTKSKKQTLIILSALLTTQISNASSNQPPVDQCPKNSTKISEKVTTNKTINYDKNKPPICITGNGGFQILKGGKLILKDTTLIISKTTISDTESSLITLEPGSTLQITNTKIISEINREITESIDNKNGGVRKIDGYQNMISGVTSPNSGIRLEILKSNITARPNNSTGGISIKTSGKNPKTASGWIRQTEFRNIYSPIKISNAKNFEITENTFKRNPGSNIAISGSRIKIEKNQIEFPGNGYIGDGITLFDQLSESTIANNDIIGGSCYGIWFYNTKYKDILVSRNNISSGITNGLHITNQQAFKNENLVIKNNNFTANSGFGVGIDSGVTGVTLISNYFIGNAALFGEYDIAVSKNSEPDIYNDNISANKIDSNWAKDNKPNRSHVNDSIKILKF